GARLSPGPHAVGLYKQARTLFAGDLLEGPDARRYTWVDERGESGVTLREHFRRLFEQATARLAELHTIAGELEGAVNLYRELTEIEPTDEGPWRSLFRLHAERRDRTCLMREEHRMRQALRDLAAELGESSG